MSPSLVTSRAPGAVTASSRSVTPAPRSAARASTCSSYNNTITNTPVGVEVHSDSDADPPRIRRNPTNLVLLNNTFYNNAVGLAPIGVRGPRQPARTTVYWSGDEQHLRQLRRTQAIRSDRPASTAARPSTTCSGKTPDGDLQIERRRQRLHRQHRGRSSATPDFVDPANGNFQLGPNSAAIDASRSEIGPLPGGDAIFPTVTQIATQAPGGRCRPPSASEPTRRPLTFPATPGRSNPSGGLANITDPRKLVNLPGRSFQNRDFFDQWVPVLTTDPKESPAPPRTRARITTPRSAASATRSASSARTIRRAQRRVRLRPVLRHRCVRASRVQPAESRRR